MAIKILKDYTVKYNSQYSYYMLGDMYLNQEKYKEALKYFEDCLNLEDLPHFSLYEYFMNKEEIIEVRIKILEILLKQKEIEGYNFISHLKIVVN